MDNEFIFMDGIPCIIANDLQFIHLRKIDNMPSFSFSFVADNKTPIFKEIMDEFKKAVEDINEKNKKKKK